MNMGYTPPPPPFSPKKVYTNRDLIKTLRDMGKLNLEIATVLGLLGDIDPVEIVELKKKELKCQTQS